MECTGQVGWGGGKLVGGEGGRGGGRQANRWYSFSHCPQACSGSEIYILFRQIIQVPENNATANIYLYKREVGWKRERNGGVMGRGRGRGERKGGSMSATGPMEI